MAAWKGDLASKGAKRKRARKLYPLGRCERCNDKATDRHHKDNNTGNNDPSNIEILCRACHMKVDGRMEAFVQSGAATRLKKAVAKPCVNCGRRWKPLRKGRCSACDLYFRAYGKERTQQAVERWHRIHATTWNQDQAETK